APVARAARPCLAVKTWAGRPCHVGSETASKRHDKTQPNLLSFMRLHVELLQPRLLFTVTASGAETLVNLPTPVAMQTPAIASDPAGDSVVVWSSAANGGGIYGQRYNTSGSAVGSQFAIDQAGAATN